MATQKIRHSILVPCYNQQNFIEETLDSVLSQSVPAYEIIVGDDFSTDGTWDLVCRYQQRHPDLIRCFRNVRNLGLFGNLNHLKRMPTGDIVSYVAGDDLLDKAFISSVNLLAERNGISDFDEEMIFLTNSEEFGSGGMINYDNFAFRNQSVIPVLLRGALHIWDTGFSAGLFRKMPEYREDLGNHADTLQIFQRTVLAKRIFFVDGVGYHYRKNSGVTFSTNAKRQGESYLRVLRILQRSFSAKFRNVDKRYIEFLIRYYSYLLRPKLVAYIRLLASRLRPMDLPRDSKYAGIRPLIPKIVKKSVASFCPQFQRK